MHAIRAEIRERYAAAARTVLLHPALTNSSIDGAQSRDPYLEDGPVFGSGRYSSRELAAVPLAAARASLGCGSPTVDAPLSSGQIVLDIGCGGGIDSILAAAAVMPCGRVVGVDMSEEMAELARRNAAGALLDNAVFVAGLMEDLPVPDQLIDVVISNSVINLSTEKERTLTELFRVLVPAGRLHVIDLVADDCLSPADRMERVAATNATAGLFSITEYCEVMRSAGFSDVRVTPRHDVADRVMAALVTGTRA